MNVTKSLGQAACGSQRESGRTGLTTPPDTVVGLENRGRGAAAETEASAKARWPRNESEVSLCSSGPH